MRAGWIGWMAIAMVALGTGCGSGGVPSADECDHVWGYPSGYMASACCRTQQDCIAADQGQYQCTPSDEPLPPGFCPPGECRVDADCRTNGGTSICRIRACPIPDEGQCEPGCTSNTQCAESESCDMTTNRCAAKRCTLATECPIDFECYGGACARASCATDSDCQEGYCVTGTCHALAGECRGPVG